jgi:hypothetical protein
MTVHKRVRGKKYYSVAEANATLPLLRAILRDITNLARDLHERHERLARLQQPGRGAPADAYREEVEQIQADFERDQERMHEYEQEIKGLGIELKDYFTGLVDFPCWMDNREVYLCWRLGEPEVAHWHELEAGFAGRRKLMAADATKSH